jgi:hypothetical protein
MPVRGKLFLINTNGSLGCSQVNPIKIKHMQRG